jgi:hypothetical protein
MNKITLKEQLIKQSIFLGMLLSKIETLEQKCFIDHPDFYPDIFKLYAFLKDNINTICPDYKINE